MSKNLLMVLISIFLIQYLPGSLAQAQQNNRSNPCVYGDYSGRPIRLYQRIEADASDWYSRYKAVQFCVRTGVAESYVIITEELIHGFVVRNPPRSILSTSTDSTGVTYYNIADQIDHVVLKTSPDAMSMFAFGTWVHQKYQARLKLAVP